MRARVRLAGQVNPITMSHNLEAAQARRYLLGEATEAERSAIEREYFSSDEAVDSIAAAEDDLIEDYLSDQLTPAERRVFERDYLASPHHQRRVETIRQLMVAASRTEPGHAATESSRSPAPAPKWRVEARWLALAAALILVVAGSLWLVNVRRDQRATFAENRPPPVSTAPPAPAVPVQPPSSSAAARIFAVSISPAAVRSAAETPSVILPAGTEMLVLHLEGDGTPLVGGRGSVRTVSGDDIWSGPTASVPDLPSGVIARIDVPAARLPVDDYVVTLFGIDGKGAEERARYFLRVRAR